MPDKKILVVDDEKEILGLVEDALSAEGYDVDTAASAGEAFDKIKSFSPDLILIDILLPDMEGPDVIRKLSGDVTTQHIPAVFFSGIVTRNKKNEATTQVRVGDQQYAALSKPFSSQELMVEVRKAIG